MIETKNLQKTKNFESKVNETDLIDILSIPEEIISKIDRSIVKDKQVKYCESEDIILE